MASLLQLSKQMLEMEMHGENSKKIVLIVKNLPKKIEDLSAFLKTSAEQVKSFRRRRALLYFSDKTEAEKNLNGLQERGFTVAKFTTHEEENGENVWKKQVNRSTQTKRSKNVEKDEEDLTENIKAFCSGNLLKFDMPPPPFLKYTYPSINADILNNISNALMNNKRFYIQVLHLMNRMNLEPPFVAKSTPITPQKFLINAGTQTTDSEPLKELTIPQSVSEEEETELETSEDEEANQKKIKQTIKRKSDLSSGDAFKKKARKLLEQTQKIPISKVDTSHTNNSTPTHTLNEVFEDATKKKPAKIALKLLPTAKVDSATMESSFQPPADLSSNRMEENELQLLPVYKNYTIGVPSNKLYIKNLAKKVTSGDLLAVYKRFAPPDHLEINVMQQGRMKGQAFVTFSGLSNFDTQEIVLKALQATHGFILQLGLIETIYVDGAGPENNNSSTKSKKSHYNQPYTYVVAVDFEATCWEKQAPPRWREAEIIEFPAVLVNLKTGKIEAEFHKYVMPMESPKLSAFCKKLTGITQKSVDNGIPLQTALMMFQEWLRKELRARNLTLPKMSKDNKVGNCAFVTWTDWDFGVCLAKECERKNLKKPPFFNQWIDIRAIYREWYKYRPLNFNDALNHVGLTFEGRAHSGIDDAKNLATLTYQMIRDGARLSLTKDLTPFQLNSNCVL